MPAMQKRSQAQQMKGRGRTCLMIMCMSRWLLPTVENKDGLEFQGILKHSCVSASVLSFVWNVEMARRGGTCHALAFVQCTQPDGLHTDFGVMP
eukprot:CAMPEP_0184655146 /NCGR_PEP_ID=MMETSP0308-20130426/12761_1 /TAXON_ID=38269 /ORGANISM="Gloeochaete witrockiana, Strain SAG 46.84" /LENGTH=93 /DNA_ID=CAMNT_0027091441 /DNA_START=1440 /DNA_END=1721 /DNA_ORIENTATION=-